MAHAMAGTPGASAGPRGKVIVEATVEFPRNGEGSFVCLRSGELVYFYGAWPTTGDDAKGTCIARVVSKDNGETWSAPSIVLREADRDLYHPGLVRLAEGRLGLAYTKRKSGTKLAEKVFRSSRDDGATWSDEVPISDGGWRYYITGAHDRLVRLANGRLVCPTFLSRNNSAVVIGKQAVAAALVYTSDDQGATWQRRTPSPLCARDGAAEPHCEEPGVVEWRPGHLLMFCRTARGTLYESRSTDHGETWSPLAASTLPGPRAPARLERIPGSDSILVVWNSQVSGKDWHKGARLTLACQTSPDGGRTWENYTQLEYDGKTWYDYPNVLWVRDTLHVAYRATGGAPGGRHGTVVRYLKLDRGSLLRR
ncbi:MAG TPA: sialidase family protein [Planctomycetota bacterium]|nr:sialidase family protein [Planctomycetota bacterium]